LFEPEKNKTTLEIDFPADFFKELLDFFDQYNFTIDENSPDDHEVGIDPEMLGHIFENLLEDNRDKGAFYTPKEIVQYMCKESLIQYLLNTFQEQKDIEGFIRFHLVSPYLAEKENAVLLNQMLDDIKVCDPAIGSGAFPIGMLQEIFEAKRFIYPYLKTNQDFKPAEVKKDIIQNSIYGVDLEKGAVDIAQLRFWLSLVVDELNPHPLPNLDYKIMQGNSLLESFDGVDLSQMGKTKSDMAVAEPVRDLFGNIADDQMKMTFAQSKTTEEVQKLIKQFFSIEKTEDKKTIRDKINHLVLQHIEYNIELRENQLSRLISEAGNPDNLNKTARKRYDVYVADLNKIQQTKAELLKIQEKTERPYFLWHLYFMDVFEQGGFDIVIGNPPYLRIQGIRDVDSAFADYLTKTFKSASGSFDLYTVFVEKSLDLIHHNGIVNFIMPIKWTNAAFGKGLRGVISGKRGANKIINFGAYQVFNASTYTGLQWYKPNSAELLYFELDRDLKSNNELAHYLQTLNIEDGTHIPSDKLTKETWTLTAGGTSKIIDKLNLQPRRISDVFEKVFQGLATSKDNVYFLYDCVSEVNHIVGFSKQLGNQIKIEKEFVKPLLKGEDVHRYDNITTNRVVVFPYKLVNGSAELYKEDEIKNQFPLAYAYLKECEDVLRDREKGRFNIDGEWFQFGRKQGINFAEKKKLVAPEISLGGNFALDENGRFYSSTTIYGYIKKENITESYKSLLAVLNSQLFWWYLTNTGTVLANGYFRFMPHYTKPFPMPEISNEIARNLEKLVDDILASKAKNKNANTTELEEKINKIVYDLYNLTSEEIELVRKC
jgi:hypothetical protein